jgi:hypothetical protein
MTYRGLVDALMAERAAGALRELDAAGKLTAAIPELEARARVPAAGTALLRRA